MRGPEAHSGPGGLLSRPGPSRHGGGAAVTCARLVHLVRLHSVLDVSAILAALRHEGDDPPTSVPSGGSSGDARSVNRSVTETRPSRPRRGDTVRLRVAKGGLLHRRNVVVPGWARIRGGHAAAQQFEFA